MFQMGYPNMFWPIYMLEDEPNMPNNAMKLTICGCGKFSWLNQQCFKKPRAFHLHNDNEPLNIWDCFWLKPRIPSLLSPQSKLWWHCHDKKYQKYQNVMQTMNHQIQMLTKFTLKSIQVMNVKVDKKISYSIHPIIWNTIANFVTFCELIELGTC